MGRSAFPDHVTNNPAFFTLLATLADDQRAEVLSAICSSNYFEVKVIRGFYFIFELLFKMINVSCKKLFTSTAVKYFLCRADNRSFLRYKLTPNPFQAHFFFRKCLRRHLELFTDELVENQSADFEEMVKKIFIVGLKSNLHRHRVHKMLEILPSECSVKVQARVKLIFIIFVKIEVEKWLEKSNKSSSTKLSLPSASTDACVESMMMDLDGFADVVEFQAPFSNCKYVKLCSYRNVFK